MAEIKKVFYVPPVLPEYVGTLSEDDANPDAAYSFRLADDTLTLSAELSGGATEQLSLNISDNLGNAVDWVRLAVYDGYVCRTEPVHGGYGQTSYQQRRARSKLARIVIEPEGGIIIAFLYRCKSPCEDAEPITGEGLAEVLCDCSDWLKEKYRAVRKKADFLRDVDSYDTLSYLEAQVDLLTRIVSSSAACLTGNTTLTESEAEALFSSLKVADANSVLDVKPLEKVTAEFSEKKAGFRSKQKAFYNE